MPPPEHRQDSPWKFWRRLSTRRSSKHRKDWASAALTATSNDRQHADRTRPGHPDLGSTSSVADGQRAASALTSGSLPDVVDRAVLRRTNSAKAPPKPPRLFLFRSSTTRLPRHSGALGTPTQISLHGRGVRESVGYDPGELETEPIYVNAAFGAALKTGLSGNDRIIPPSLSKTTIQSSSDYCSAGGDRQAADNSSTTTTTTTKEADVVENLGQSAVVEEVDASPTKTAPEEKGTRAAHTGTVPRPQRPTSAIPVTDSTYLSLPHRHRAARRRLTSPDVHTSHRRPAASRGQRQLRSGDKAERRRRHTHILRSIGDLLCHSLDPFPLLSSLEAASILTPKEVETLRAVPDRRQVCEELLGVLTEGGPTLFTSFVEVLRGSGTAEEIVSVLNVVGDVDRLVHELPSPQEDVDEEGEHSTADTQVLAEDRMVAYEVGYLAPDGVTLKPVVELEKARSIDRRFSQRVFRISGASVLSGDCRRYSRFNDSSIKNCSDNSASGDVPSVGRVMVAVCVTGHKLSGQRALALAQVLRRHHCLLELRIGKTGLSSADLAAVCGSLLHNPSLASLDIRLNALDFVGASAVASVLSHTRALRQLNLSSTGLDVAGCRGVLSALASNDTLIDLDLSFLDVGDAVCEGVRDMLKVNTRLQRLRLRSNGISTAGCAAVAEGLTRNRTLQELDLSRNDLGDEGVQSLSRSVPLSFLEELSLENCNVTSSACEALARMTSSSKRLRLLDVSVNHLGDEGVLKLSAGWDQSPSLHTVGLNMCGITNGGFSSLLDVLEKTVSIRLLKLCYNRLGRCHTHDPAASSDNLRYRLRIVTSSRPRLKILLWGNSFDQA